MAGICKRCEGQTTNTRAASPSGLCFGCEHGDNPGGRRKQPLPDPVRDEMSTWVLCLNDFPIGVYSTAELAVEAKNHDKNQRRTDRPLMAHYHIHEFTVDRETHL